MTIRPLDERGLTLTEVTIVAAIGLLVLLGLGGFYLNSQSTWLDASSQSITQREATLVSEALADSIRASGSAIASDDGNPEHGRVQLFRYNETTPYWCYWWHADSLIHHGPNLATDRGAVLSSKAERFQVDADTSIVRVALRLRSATGQRVEVSTSTLMRNR
jgi:Tfp pilus assembly protein PilV